MNCAFLYNSKNKNEVLMLNLKHIEKELNKIFGNVDIIGLNSIKEVEDFYEKKSGLFEYVIHSGGDGTFNLVCNFIEKSKKKPIIGYLPTGTACDNARKFKLSKNINKTLKIFAQKNHREIEVMKINDFYVSYVFSKGKFVRVSYDTNRILKKLFGPFAYFFRGLKEVFRKERFQLELTFNNEIKINDAYTLILITNSNSIGGMKIRKEFEENVINVYTFKKSLYTLFLFFMFKEKSIKLSKHIKKYQCQTVKVKVLKSITSEWSYDGEVLNGNDFNISIKNNHFKLLVPKEK